MAIKGIQSPSSVGGSSGPALLGWAEVCQLTGMSRKTIEKCQRARRNPFPPRRLLPTGGKWFRRVDVEQWLASMPKAVEDGAE